MHLDRDFMLSDDQAITASAASTDYVNLSAANRDIGAGTPLELIILITETFNNLTDLTFTIQSDDNTSFSSPKDHTKVTVLAADLVAGNRVNLGKIPEGINEQYVRVNYTVNGTAPTTGKVFTGVASVRQTAS